MKLKKIVGATLASTMVLAGCSSSSSAGKQVDGKYVLASVDDKNFTADDFYQSMLDSSDSATEIYQAVLLQLVNKYNPVNDDMNEELQTLKDKYQEYIDNGYEAYLLQQIQSYGYNTLDEYYDGYVQYLQICDFFNDYIEAHYDEIFEDYYTLEHPKKVYHILVQMEDPDNPTEEEWAKVEEIQKLLDQGKDFQETAKAYSDDSTAEDGGYLGICDDNSGFVTEFMDMMDTLTPGTISEPFKTTYGYHFMYIPETTEDELKEELNDPDSSLRDWSSGDFYDSYLEYVIYDSYDIEYSDDTVKEKVEAYVQSYLDQRAALRETDTTDTTTSD